MTDQEIKDLVASLAIGNAELRESQRVANKEFKEAQRVNRAEFKESRRVANEELREAQRVRSEELKESRRAIDRQIESTNEQMKATDRKLKSLGIHLDGITKTTGEDVEEFFYSSLTARDLKLGNIKFDVAIKNLLSKKKDGRSHEIDIFLENGNSVAIIEVKNKVKQQSLEQLDSIIENFYEFHPAFKNYKIQGAIAGKIFSKDLQKRALKKGFIVLTQQGNNIETTLA